MGAIPESYLISRATSFRFPEAIHCHAGGTNPFAPDLPPALIAERSNLIIVHVLLNLDLPLQGRPFPIPLDRKQRIFVSDVNGSIGGQDLNSGYDETGV